MQDNKLTVAIVTARRNEDTRYAAWRDLGRAIMHGEHKDPNVSGEWLGLLAALNFFPPVVHHVFYQLRALALQTEPPNEVLVIDRLLGDNFEEIADALDAERLPFVVRWMQPKLGAKEFANDPYLGLYHAQVISPEPSLCGLPKRNTAVPYGNSDKNTALIHAAHENLLMLDDCCIPGYALVHHAKTACAAKKILLIGHRAFYLPNQHHDYVEIADANWQPDSPRHVFGIWAMPLQYMLDINGFNVELDGKRGSWDVELKARMDMYCENRGRKYTILHGARCYEIEHDYPWNAAGKHDENPKVDAWLAPGTSLSTLRKAYLAGQSASWITVDGESTEEENSEEEGFEGEE